MYDCYVVYANIGRHDERDTMIIGVAGNKLGVEKLVESFCKANMSKRLKSDIVPKYYWMENDSCCIIETPRLKIKNTQVDIWAKYFPINYGEHD